MNLLYCVDFFLLWTFSFAGGAPFPDVTYEELERIGASCNTLDNCKFRRDKDTLTFYNCHCGSFCSQLGTCCIDSPYREKQVGRFQSSCKNPYGTFNSHYFFEDSCPPDTSNDSIWGELCRDSNSEDLLSLVPVTSSSTNITYSNYFCFRCNERSNRYRYWNLRISTGAKSSEKVIKNVTLTYNSSNHTWVAPIGQEDSIIPVTFSMEVPDEIEDLAKTCVPDVISSCSKDWKNDIIDTKCKAYTSIVHFIKDEETLSYRNPHCALCNFESIDNMLCSLQIAGRAPSTKTFSFTYLLDINRSDGEIVGEIQRCDNDSIWDPFFKKCRILKCAKPGYIVQNGKCIPP